MVRYWSDSFSINSDEENKVESGIKTENNHFKISAKNLISHFSPVHS